MRSFLPSCKVDVWSCVTSSEVGCSPRVVDASNRYNVSDISVNSRYVKERLPCYR